MMQSSALDASVPFDEATTILWIGSIMLDGVEWFLDHVFGAGMDLLADLLGTPMLGYPYMQRAYLVTVCIAVIGPVVGTFLVHREMAMIGPTTAVAVSTKTVPSPITLSGFDRNSRTRRDRESNAYRRCSGARNRPRRLLSPLMQSHHRVRPVDRDIYKKDQPAGSS